MSDETTYYFLYYDVQRIRLIMFKVHYYKKTDYIFIINTSLINKLTQYYYIA